MTEGAASGSAYVSMEVVLGTHFLRFAPLDTLTWTFRPADMVSWSITQQIQQAGSCMRSAHVSRTGSLQHCAGEYPARHGLPVPDAYPCIGACTLAGVGIAIFAPPLSPGVIRKAVSVAMNRSASWPRIARSSSDLHEYASAMNNPD